MDFTKKGALLPALQKHLAYMAETLGDEQQVRKVDLAALAEKHYPNLTAQLLPYSAAIAEAVFLECHREGGPELVAEKAFWDERFLPAANDLIFIGACVGYGFGEMPRPLALALKVTAFAGMAAEFYADEEAIMQAAFSVAKTDSIAFEHAYRRIEKCYEPLQVSQQFSLTVAMRMVAFGLLMTAG